MKKVLVTGTTGFIASHVVQQLLKSGYSVRGTVRDITKPNASQLQELFSGSDEALELIEANLLNGDSWQDAAKGCDYVLHLASPFPLGNPSNEDDVIRPAVDGTLNVLRASSESNTVRRVVLTSSAAAVAGNAFQEPTHVYSEQDWTDITDTRTLAYTKSKTLAEKAAWDFMEKQKERDSMDLVVLNPCYVMGPVLLNTQATSMEVIRRLMNREVPLVPKLNLRIVDVRDVARAHVAAMLNQEASGQRHILFTENIWFKQVAEILHEEFNPKGYRVPTSEAPNFLLKGLSYFKPSMQPLVQALGKVQRLDNSRMRNVLGIEPFPLKTTVLDMATSMIKMGMIKRPT